MSLLLEASPITTTVWHSQHSAAPPPALPIRSCPRQHFKAHLTPPDQLTELHTPDHLCPQTMWTHSICSRQH